MQLSNDLVNSWIEKEPNEYLKKIKKKIIRNISYVSPEVFESKLRESTFNAFKKINEEFVVLWDYKPHSSKRWVYYKILDILPKKPVLASYYAPTAELLAYKNNSQFVGTIDYMINKNIGTLVIFDDAAYSAEQLINRIILPISKIYSSKNKQLKIYLVIPFITNLAKRNIDLAIKNNSLIKVELYYSQIMKNLLEILSESEINTLKTLDKEEFRYLGCTLTFFDHRVADDHSFFEEVERLIIKSKKPYSSESAYGEQEKKDWDNYWTFYLGNIKKED